MLIAIHLIVCSLLIGIVLLQQGKGADIGASFGGGGNTLFGAAGADNLLTKVTTIIALGFMVSSIILAMIGPTSSVNSGELFGGQPQGTAPEATLPAAAPLPVAPTQSAAAPVGAPNPAATAPISPTPTAPTPVTAPPPAPSASETTPVTP